MTLPLTEFLVPSDSVSSTTEHITLETVVQIDQVVDSGHPVIIKGWEKMGFGYVRVLYTCGMTELGLDELMLFAQEFEEESIFISLVSLILKVHRSGPLEPQKYNALIDEIFKGRDVLLEDCTDWFIKPGNAPLTEDDFLDFKGFIPELCLIRLVKRQSDRRPKIALLSVPKSTSDTQAYS